MPPQSNSGVSALRFDTFYSTEFLHPPLHFSRKHAILYQTFL